MRRVPAEGGDAGVDAALEQRAEGRIALVVDEQGVRLPARDQLIGEGGAVERLLQPFERGRLRRGIGEVERPHRVLRIMVESA